MDAERVQNQGYLRLTVGDGHEHPTLTRVVGSTLVVPVCGANGESLQLLYSQSCSNYALMYLIDRAEGRNLKESIEETRLREQ